MKKICIIPARAGSKRIQNKNLKEISGKPLVSWTIECALESGTFDQVILSTDSQEIANIGFKYGLPDVGLRPQHLSGDHATAANVIEHYVVNSINDKICYLQPTSPLRSVEDIIESLNLMERENAYSVISVCPYEIPENWVYGSDNNFDKFIENISNTRSQDYPARYVLNGALYWFTSEKFNEYKTHLIPERSFPYVMPKSRSVDIDTLDDFKLAELYLDSNLR